MALDFYSNNTTLISPSHPSEISKTNQAPLRTLGARMAALVAGVSSMCNASAAKSMMRFSTYLCAVCTSKLSARICVCVG
jgi:hypothetical protein